MMAMQNAVDSKNASLLIKASSANRTKRDATETETWHASGSTRLLVLLSGESAHWNDSTDETALCTACDCAHEHPLKRGRRILGRTRNTVKLICLLRWDRDSSELCYRASRVVGSPSRIQVRLTSALLTAAFARAVASPIVIGVTLKIMRYTC